MDFLKKKNSKGQENILFPSLMSLHHMLCLSSYWLADALSWIMGVRVMMGVSLPRMLYGLHNAEVKGEANSRRWTFQAHAPGEREMNGLPY